MRAGLSVSFSLRPPRARGNKKIYQGVVYFSPLNMRIGTDVVVVAVIGVGWGQIGLYYP